MVWQYLAPPPQEGAVRGLPGFTSGVVSCRRVHIPSWWRLLKKFAHTEGKKILLPVIGCRRASILPTRCKISQEKNYVANSHNTLKPIIYFLDNDKVLKEKVVARMHCAISLTTSFDRKLVLVILSVLSKFLATTNHNNTRLIITLFFISLNSLVLAGHHRSGLTATWDAQKNSSLKVMVLEMPERLLLGDNRGTRSIHVSRFSLSISASTASVH